MDASQRWETEALRSGSLSRKNPPRPSAKKEATEAEDHDGDTDWVTLKEAEAATGIPVNTLRKWARKSAIPSYLESDGDLSLRMVDIDAVVAHAHDLGREVTPGPLEPDPEDADETADVEPTDDEEPEEDTADDTVDEPQDGADIDTDEHAPPMPPEGTLIVPLDAWNKMLNQLGNLHEAGQQLAEARERAAKAETEATFLRERLAEVREQTAEEPVGVPLSRGTAEGRSPDAGGSAVPQPPSLVPHEDETPEEQATTSYWRYLTFGWRDRKKRTSKKT